MLVTPVKFLKYTFLRGYVKTPIIGGPIGIDENGRRYFLCRRTAGHPLGFIIRVFIPGLQGKVELDFTSITVLPHVQMHAVIGERGGWQWAGAAQAILFNLGQDRGVAPFGPF
jgi:hypothetical protein